MPDSSESMIERRLTELEVLYASLTEDIALLQAEIAANKGRDGSSGPEVAKLTARLKQLQARKHRIEADLDALEAGDAA
jgi:uncharacterized coiled-coil protein SlyX